jgi:hypothetical protein
MQMSHCRVLVNPIQDTSRFTVQRPPTRGAKVLVPSCSDERSSRANIGAGLSNMPHFTHFLNHRQIRLLLTLT